MAKRASWVPRPAYSGGMSPSTEYLALGVFLLVAFAGCFRMSIRPFSSHASGGFWMIAGYLVICLTPAAFIMAVQFDSSQRNGLH